MPPFRPNSWGYAPIGQEPYDTVQGFFSLMLSCGSEDEFRLKADTIGAWRGLRQNVWCSMFECLLKWSLGPGPARWPKRHGGFQWFQGWSLEPGTFDGLFVPGEFPRYWRLAVEEAFRLDNFVISVGDLDRDERLSKEWIAGVRAMKSAAFGYRDAVTEAYGKGIWAESGGGKLKDYTWLDDLLYGGIEFEEEDRDSDRGADFFREREARHTQSLDAAAVRDAGRRRHMAAGAR